MDIRVKGLYQLVAGPAPVTKNMSILGTSVQYSVENGLDADKICPNVLIDHPELSEYTLVDIDPITNTCKLLVKDIDHALAAALFSDSNYLVS